MKSPIKNFDEFSVKCKGHYQKLAKLRNISQKSYLDAITIDDMKKVIGEFNRNIRIDKVDGQEKLVYDSSNPWEILRLLDDDFLASDMTKEKYEVNSKHAISYEYLKAFRTRISLN